MHQPYDFKDNRNPQHYYLQRSFPKPLPFLFFHCAVALLHSCNGRATSFSSKGQLTRCHRSLQQRDSAAATASSGQRATVVDLGKPFVFNTFAGDVMIPNFFCCGVKGGQSVQTILTNIITLSTIANIIIIYNIVNIYFCFRNIFLPFVKYSTHGDCRRASKEGQAD